MNGRRALAFIVSAVLFVLIVVFASYVVFMKFRPEAEIPRMLRAMSKVETVRERSAFSWSVGSGKERTTTSTYLVGQVDLSALPLIQQDTRFRMFQINGSKTYGDLSGELRTVGGTSYLSVVPKDAWISFADGELVGLGDVIPGVRLPALTDDAILRLRDLLATADVFLVRYDDVTEIVDGHATRVIEARFDPDATRAFLLDLVRAREGRDPSDAERILVEARAKQLEQLRVRLWIGIRDHLLYRFQAAGTVEAADETRLPLGKASVDVLVNLTDYNAPFDAAAPKKATHFVPVADGSLETSGAMFGTSSFLVTNDAARLPAETTTSSDDADNDGLSATVEAFYQTNPSKPDTDGDGKTDGEEVLSGQNPNGTGSLFGFGFGH